MKKRIFAIAFVISVIIGLSACKNPPIFAAIEQEVKLNPASVKGFVRGVVKVNDKLYTSNGKIWYKAKGETGKWSELSGCPGRCTGLAVSGPNLYAAFEQNDTFTIYWYDTATPSSSWTEVPGLTAKAVFGTRVVFAVNLLKNGNTMAYTISSAIESGTPNTWASPTDKAPVGAAGLYCLLEDGLYKNDSTKITGSPSSGLKGICDGPTLNSVFVVDNTKLYCYDGSASTWTNIVHGVSSPQSITYLPSKQLVLISGIKGYGEIKLTGNVPTLTGAHTVSAGSADSSVPPGNILQYNNSVGKYVINPIYAFENGTGYVIYAGINDPNTRYTGLWGFYNPGQIEWNRE